MFVLGNFISGVTYLINILLNIMMVLIFVRAIVSWFNPDPVNPIYQFLQRTTEPVLEPIRRLMPPLPIDLSPIIAFFIIRFLQIFLVSSLYGLAFRLQ